MILLPILLDETKHKLLCVPHFVLPTVASSAIVVHVTTPHK